MQREEDLAAQKSLRLRLEELEAEQQRHAAVEAELAEAKAGAEMAPQEQREAMEKVKAPRKALGANDEKVSQLQTDLAKGHQLCGEASKACVELKKNIDKLQAQEDVQSRYFEDLTPAREELRNLQKESAHYQTTKAAVTVSKEAAVATLRDELEQLRAAKEQLSSQLQDQLASALSTSQQQEQQREEALQAVLEARREAEAAGDEASAAEARAEALRQGPDASAAAVSAAVSAAEEMQERRWRLQLQKQRSWVRTCTWQLSSCAAPRRLSRWRTPRPSSTLRRGSCSEPRHSCTEAKAMNEKLMSEFDSHELSPES